MWQRVGDLAAEKLRGKRCRTLPVAQEEDNVKQYTIYKVNSERDGATGGVG